MGPSLVPGLLGALGRGGPPALVKFGARHPNVVASPVKGFSFQTVRIEGPCQTPIQEIVTKVTNPPAQPRLAVADLEPVAPGEPDPSSLAHLPAERPHATHR